MKGEAVAYAKYHAVRAAGARTWESRLAALVRQTAKTQRLEHFREHAPLAGLVSPSDADNLRDAIAGETYETTKMYPEMVARARLARDNQAAARFTEIGKDESKHRDAFAAALAKLDRARQNSIEVRNRDGDRIETATPGVSWTRAARICGLGRAAAAAPLAPRRCPSRSPFSSGKIARSTSGTSLRAGLQEY